jgi:hypothetical protein
VRAPSRERADFDDTTRTYSAEQQPAAGTDPNDYCLECPVRTTAARALASLGHTVRVEGHEFIATK